TEETVYWSAMLGAAELLLGGTTAILDMETVHHTQGAFRALERIGLRAVVGKCLMDAHPEGAPLELAESTDTALAEAESLARRWHGAAGDRLRVCFAPRFVPSCSGALPIVEPDARQRRGTGAGAARGGVPRGDRCGRRGVQQPARRVCGDAPRRAHPEAAARRGGAPRRQGA